MNIKERITMFQIIILIMLLPLVGCTKYDNEAIPNDETEVSSIQNDKNGQRSTIELPEFKENEDHFTKEEMEALGIQENMLAYWMVLNNRKPLVSANEGCQEFFWNEYFWCTTGPDPLFTIYDFGIVDLDNDGSEELVMTGFPETTQVLDYQEGKVYSYQFVYRGMKGITAGGVYNSSSGADIGGFHRVYLDKGSYKEETLAYMEHDYFEVEGIEVTSQEFFAYTETFANSEQMETTDFTEEMLDKILLGSLREEELSMVKRVETEEICEENNPQKADIPEDYLDVLTGKEEFICVTKNGEKFSVDGDCVKNTIGKEVYQVLYFSTVDMDGDGEDEVVLTCAGSNLVLHAAKDVIYGYVFEYWNEMGDISKEGVFKTGYPDENKYGKILSFDDKGCRMELIENYETSHDDRIQYYFFSQEQIVEAGQQKESLPF